MAPEILLGIQETLDLIKPGQGLIDLDEDPGDQGIIETVADGWVTINWSRAGRWATPLFLVVSSIQTQEWVFTDSWCSTLTIPETEPTR